MRKAWMSWAVTVALTLGSTSAVVAAERVADPLGDVVGDAPDIVGVTFGQPEGERRLSVSIEFAQHPPLDTDWESYTDVVFIHLHNDPETVQTIQFEEEDEYDYIIGTHAVQLPGFLEFGGMVYEPASGEVHENVVDVAVDGTTLTWTVDRDLLGDPEVISWAVLAGTEVEADEMSFDVSPNEGEPWGVYELDEAEA